MNVAQMVFLLSILGVVLSIDLLCAFFPPRDDE